MSAVKFIAAVTVIGVLVVLGGYVKYLAHSQVKCPANPIDFRIEIYKQGTYVCARSVHIVGKNYVLECVDPTVLGFPYYNEE